MNTHQRRHPQYQPRVGDCWYWAHQESILIVREINQQGHIFATRSGLPEIHFTSTADMFDYMSYHRVLQPRSPTVEIVGNELRMIDG
jgi:hypothetical protein